MISYIMKILYKIKSKYIIWGRRKYWKNEFLPRVKSKHLDTKQKNEIKRYYNAYKKNIKVDFLYHNFYLEKTNKFDVNYIPDDIFYCYIDPYFNDWKSAKVIDNKCLYYRLFQNVSQPAAIAFRINNVWLNDKLERIDVDKLLKILSNVDAFVIKEAVDSCGGKGIYFTSGDERIHITKKAIKNIKCDIVIQEVLKQHKILSSINSSSVNTIRIMSLLSDNGVKIYSSILRMGIGDSKVDNASSGGITCGINENGKLNNYAYSVMGDKFKSHPSSKIKFSSIILPNYGKVKKLIYELHPTIPMSRLISWDIAIDESGEPVLIEVNLKYGELDFHQLNNGPVFGDDTEKILNEVFKGRKK